MAKQVEITDLGELHWLLGIEIRRDRSRLTLALSQRSYLASILRRYGFEDLKPVSISMDVNICLTTAQSPSTPAEYAEMRDKPYHEAVGSAMCATIGTRPDTAYPNQTVSRFSSNLGIAHWNAVKNSISTTNELSTYGLPMVEETSRWRDIRMRMGTWLRIDTLSGYAVHYQV